MCSAKQLIRVEQAKGPALVSHRNAPLSFEGRLRLVRRCRRRPISHVAAEMGISRACASKWVNRYRRFGEVGLIDRSSTPHHSPRATPAWAIERIEAWRRERKWSATRIAHELVDLGFQVKRRTVSRQLTRLGLGRRRFLDPNGQSNRVPGKITARWPGHMVHLDVKKVGRIPDGGGWRIHGRDSAQRRAVDRAKTAGARGGYVYLHSIIDGYSRLAYTEPLADEQGATAAAFLARAKVWFAAHGIIHLHRVVTDIQSGWATFRNSWSTGGEDRCRPAPARHRWFTEWGALRLLAC
jgi:transposase